MYCVWCFVLLRSTGYHYRPQPVFKWYKDGELISKDDGDSTVSNIFFDGKGLVLQIINIKKENAGIYKCIATNSEGTDAKEAEFIVHCKLSV